MAEEKKTVKKTRITPKELGTKTKPATTKALRKMAFSCGGPKDDCRTLRIEAQPGLLIIKCQKGFKGNL